MKESIDYQLKDIINNKENAALIYELDPQKIKKIINQFETIFFEDKNIFRANDKKSDYLFRFEIKDLLVLLIYIESCNPFDKMRINSSFNNNDVNNLKKISEAIKRTNFPDYERILIDHAYQENIFVDKADDLILLKDSFVDLFTIIAVNYYTFSPAYFKELTDTINKISFNIARHKVDFDSYSNDMGEENLKKSKMNFIHPLVNLIHEISEFLYDFDEGGCCKRKDFFDDAFKRLRKMVPDSDTYVKILKNKKSKILSTDNESYLQYVDINIDCDEDRKIATKVRNDIQDFLDNYYECFFDILKKDKYEEVSYVDNMINERDKGVKHINHERHIKNYLQNWYIVSAKLNDVFDERIEKNINLIVNESLKEDDYYNIITNSNAESYEEFAHNPKVVGSNPAAATK